MGVSSEVGDSICIFLQAFDVAIGLVCCAFICCLCCAMARACIEAATLRRAAANMKDV